MADRLRTNTRTKVSRYLQTNDNVVRLNERFGYGYDKSGNLSVRTNGALLQNFISDPANELTGITRNSLLTFADGADTILSNATMNGQGAAIYSDQSFAMSTLDMGLRCGIKILLFKLLTLPNFRRTLAMSLEWVSI